MRLTPWVVKIGGRLCEDRDSLETLARACAALRAPLVLVHGGGDAVSRLQTTLGYETQFVDGLRVTARRDVEVLEMVLSGTINKSLVRALEAAGRPASGLSGCDGGLVECALVPGLGRVGNPVQVDARLLNVLLEAGWTPVVSPVSLGPDAEPVNVNADAMAAALAAALGAQRLLLLSDVEGVRSQDAWLDVVPHDMVEALVASGTATGGMIPKLRAAAVAVAGGVREVCIGGWNGGGLDAVRGTRVQMARPADTAPATQGLAEGGVVHG